MRDIKSQKGEGSVKREQQQRRRAALTLSLLASFFSSLLSLFSDLSRAPLEPHPSRPSPASTCSLLLSEPSPEIADPSRASKELPALLSAAPGACLALLARIDDDDDRRRRRPTSFFQQPLPPGSVRARDAGRVSGLRARRQGGPGGAGRRAGEEKKKGGKRWRELQDRNECLTLSTS